MKKKLKVFIGYDNRMPQAFGVAAKSLLKYANNVEIIPLILPLYEAAGLYNRPTIRKDGVLFDEISGAPMASEFSLSRFLVPHLSNYEGWSLFVDSDFMFKSDINELFDLADDSKAVMVVKHDYNPTDTVKMDGQVQTQYNRKNWSSCMLFNNAKNLELFDLLKTETGKNLHQFCWLNDDDIGELPHEWNWLEGHSHLCMTPKAVHFTRGIPSMVGYSEVPYAGEWLQYESELPICKLVG